ncbi:UNVERIFIED_CONTAM: hypothetical protein B566_EDAN017739 [Ephemera danica]|nr:hypothetical protein B566_EDAN017739 [Ephemera danica]
MHTFIILSFVSENPLHCGCDAQELWEWFQDHQKLVSAHRHLRCEFPPELRGLNFLDLDPPRFCTTPLVLKLAIQDIQTLSVVVSWQPRNHSGIHGYRVAYNSLDVTGDHVKSKYMDKSSRSVKLSRLHANSRYLICVIGLTNWMPSNASEVVIPEMVESSTTRCTQVKTLEPVEGATVPIIHVSSGKASRNIPQGSLLTRRLGLIVGSTMGCIVFIVLVGCLSYLKLKKRRNVKTEEAALPQEYISYRHFSFQSGEQGQNMGTTTTLIA